MTDAEAKLLADLAACEAAATPGPWFWDDDDYMLLTGMYGKDETTWPADASHAVLLCDEPEGQYEGGRPRPNDRDFIVLCRTAVPVLLRALVEQMEENIRLRKGANRELLQATVETISKTDQLIAEVRDLKRARGN